MEQREIDFACWLSRYYLQTPLWRFWKNPNDNTTHGITKLYEFWDKNIYGKSVVLNHYPYLPTTKGDNK